MSLHRPAVMLAAALALGATAAPSVAFAAGDTTPPAATDSASFTNDDLVAALTAAEATTADKATTGWMAKGTAAMADGPTVAMKAIYTVDRGLAAAGGLGTIISAEHSGTYITVRTLNTLMPGMHVHRALDAIRKPRATWVFEPQKKLELLAPDSVYTDMAPDAVLASLVDPKQSELTGTPTATVNADKSTTYTFSVTDLTTKPSESDTGTLTINAAGRLRSVTNTTPSETDVANYTYGTRSVALPAKRKTITDEQLGQGMVLSTLRSQVKSAADMVAAVAEITARKHAVKSAAIRSTARTMVRRLNRSIDLKVLSTTRVARGVRITGTSPFRHAKASFTVRAAGKKAVVRRG